MKNNKATHWDSKTIINLKSEFAKLKSVGKSERKIAKILGVPRSTLQNWNKQKRSTSLTQTVIDFFNTPEGFDFLHMLITAILFVITKISKAGVRMAALIFDITGINKLVACSYGKLQQNTNEMDDHIIEFENIEKTWLYAE